MIEDATLFLDTSYVVSDREDSGILSKQVCKHIRSLSSFELALTQGITAELKSFIGSCVLHRDRYVERRGQIDRSQNRRNGNQKALKSRIKKNRLLMDALNGLIGNAKLVTPDDLEDGHGVYSNAMDLFNSFRWHSSSLVDRGY
ncbi:hypothetical protein HOC01_03620 [archaeon]|jgi:hypothetical protein|nr:hypothetical protein [archaeon]MBT6698500.1 hypothetical protein [archaeon]